MDERDRGGREANTHSSWGMQKTHVPKETSEGRSRMGMMYTGPLPLALTPSLLMGLAGSASPGLPPVYIALSF